MLTRMRNLRVSSNQRNVYLNYGVVYVMMDIFIGSGCMRYVMMGGGIILLSFQ